MRLAQDGAFPPPSSSSPRRDRTLLQGDLDRRRPQLPLQRKLSYLTRSSSRRILRKSRSLKAQDLASQIDATWFSSLPQKIQQCQFTREEQALFAGNRDILILDAADEALYRSGRQPDTALRSLRTDTTFHHGHNKNNLTDSAAEPLVDSAADMDESFYASFRWLDEDDDLDLTLDDYHSAVTETTHTSLPGGQGLPALRRALSLSSLNNHRKSLSIRPPQSSHSTVAPRGSGLGARPLSSLLAPLQQRQTGVSSIEPLAKHYQDPEARLKLRVYLASPQKFDEALEFGFPSLTSTTLVQPPAPTASGRRTEETERSFLDDPGSPPPEDGEERDEDTSLAESDSPQTPQDASFQPSRPWKQSSLERSSPLRPHLLGGLPDPYAQIPSGRREMTLHMTLTRPDLRTEAELRPEPVKNVDPLKLSDFPISDERHPIWGSVPEDRSKMKKLWKKLTGR